MRVCRAALTLCLMAVLGTAQASEVRIAKWTDSNGVTHFGDAQFAPATAKEVDVPPANGMNAPATMPNRQRASGPVWTVIDQAPKQNKVGWRSKGQAPQSGPVTPTHR